MACTFYRVEVWNMSRGGSLICWELSQNYFPKGPLHFYVDYGRSGTDDWVVLNPDDPVIDDCCYTDPCQRTWEMLSDHYYRVRMLQPSVPGCPVVTSKPVLGSGRLNKRDWLRAREIVRKENLQSTIDDTDGFLLKRKKFGVSCPHCRDWDTGEITDSDCPYCYGVGILGGYYPGVMFSMDIDANWSRRLTVGPPPQGVNSNIVKQARCTLYPSLDTKDIWVRADNDERYIIDKWTCVASYRGLQLVAMATLKLAPVTDIVYSVPIEPVPSDGQGSEGNGASPEPCGPTKGLKSSYEDW
jgi:hypothetical protein